MPIERWIEYSRHLADAHLADRATLLTLQQFLIYSYYPILQALLILTVVAALWALPAMGRHLRGFSARGWLCMLVLFNLSLALRQFWAPHMPQVYFDEIEFLNTSQTLAEQGVNALTTLPGVAALRRFQPCPIGWQCCISMVYRGCGVHPELAFSLAALLSALTVPLLGWFAWSVSRNERVGVLAALFLTVLPIHLRASGSTALETSSLFFLAAYLLTITVWFQAQNAALLLLATCMLSWFINIRMENGLVLAPLLLAHFTFFCPSTALRGWKTPITLMLAATTVLIFATPAVLSDYYGLATHFYFFYQGSERSAAQISQNFHGNMWYWVINRIHPAMLTVLAGIGLYHQRRLTQAWYWAAWTLLLLAFYSANPSCDFALLHTLDSWRTALNPALGVLMLAAWGADALCDLLPRGPRLLALGALTSYMLAVPFSFDYFIHSRNLFQAQWELHQRLRPTLGSDAVLLVYDANGKPAPDSLAYDIACTAGIVPRFFNIPPNQQEKYPRIAEDARTLMQVENKRVFLYHCDMGSEEDARARKVLNQMFSLHTIAFVKDPSMRARLTVWRIQSVLAQP